MIGQSVGKFYIDSNTYTGYGGIDIFIMKYDKDGNFKWAKILGTSQTDYFMNDAMQVTNEGEVLVTGNIAWENKDTITEAFFDTIKTTLHSPISRMFIANFDTNGNIKWLKNTTGFASPFSLSVDKNKNIYISGSCSDSVYLDNQMLIKKYDIPNIDNYYSSFILKCDSKGKPIWSKTISLTGSYYEILTTSDSSGNIYVTSISGHIYDSNCYFDGIKHIISKGNFIFKFNTRGNFLWYKNLNNPTFSIIKLDKDNNPILGGSFISKLILDNDTLVSWVQNDGLILKVDNLNGDLIWKKQISGCDIETVNSFAFDKNDRLYISGYYNCDSLQIDDKLIYGSKNSGHIYLAKLYQPIFEIDSIPYSDSQLVLYPNPAYDIVKVNMKNINSDQIRVIDALGRVVKVDVYSNLNQAAINVSSLPTGLYFVLYNDGQKSLNAKLLKE